MSKKISEYRSEVIEGFINIESLINSIISQHYFKKVFGTFLFEFLYDVNCNFALKKNVLQKINPGFSKLEDLNRLNNIRNFFAHCNQQFFEGSRKPGPEDTGKVLNPKDIKKELDFEKLYQEFIEKEQGVSQALFDLYASLSGKFIE